MSQSPVNNQNLRILLILIVTFAATVLFVPTSQAKGAAQINSVNASPVDPHKDSSEQNHHIAGFALIGVGLMVIAGNVSPRLRFLRYLWPALFILAGIFLAVWSDAEIWPRGNVSWGWLLHHDAEARMHKVYAILLIVMGILEYLRARGRLNRWWQVWSFPLLALLGASLLLVHDHTASSGIDSPEVRAYIINPALDPEGNPLSQSDREGPAAAATAPMAASTSDHASSMDHDMMNMDHANMQMSDMPMQNAPDSPHSHMAPAMMRIEREHFWFMIVGIAIGIFKLLDDAKFWRSSVVAHAWPTLMIVLGVLLTLYRE